MSSGSIGSNRALDRFLEIEALRWSAAAYAGDRADSPEASPVLADLRHLPPLIIQVGGHDLLRDEGIALARRAVAHGVDVQLEVYEGMQHVFQLLYAPFPEAIAARRRGLDFLLREHAPSA